jgi:glucose/arabinose dehydrogenase
MEFTPSIAPGSAMIYSGKAFPHYQGNLFVGCLAGKAILRVILDGTKPIATETMLLNKYGRIREVVEGPDGSIYFTTSERDIEVKTPAPETDRIMRLVPVAH